MLFKQFSWFHQTSFQTSRSLSLCAFSNYKFFVALGVMASSPPSSLSPWWSRTCFTVNYSDQLQQHFHKSLSFSFVHISHQKMIFSRTQSQSLMWFPSRLYFHCFSDLLNFARKTSSHYFVCYYTDILTNETKTYFSAKTVNVSSSWLERGDFWGAWNEQSYVWLWSFWCLILLNFPMMPHKVIVCASSSLACCHLTNQKLTRPWHHHLGHRNLTES